MTNIAKKKNTFLGYKIVRIRIEDIIGLNIITSLLLNIIYYK